MLGPLTRRKYLGSTAVLMSGLLAAACEAGGGEGPSSQPGKTVVVEKPAESLSLLTQPATVELWHPWSPGRVQNDVLADWAKRFRELSPNLTLMSTTVPLSEGGTRVYEPKLVTAAAAGTPPEVMILFPGNGVERLVEPVESLLKGVKGWSAADYFDGLRAAFSYQGALLMSPVHVVVQVVAVNLDMVQRAGLQPPSATWTWDEFAEYATKMTQRESDGTIRVYGLEAHNGITEFFSRLLWSEGGDWMNAAMEKLIFHQAEGVTALEKFADLTVKRRVATTAQTEEWRALSYPAAPFSIGATAMRDRLEGEQAVAWVQAPLSFRWTPVQPPRHKQRYTRAGGPGWAVIRGAKRRDGAAEFVRLVAMTEHVIQWCKATGNMVPSKLAASQPAWTEFLRAQPVLAPFNDALPYVRLYPPLPGWGDVLGAKGSVNQGLVDAITGTVPPRQALEEAARVGQAIVDRIRQES